MTYDEFFEMSSGMNDVHDMMSEMKSTNSKKSAYELCRGGVLGCINCNNDECKNGSLFVEMGNSCENRIFEADDELCDYINSQYH